LKSSEKEGKWRKSDLQGKEITEMASDGETMWSTNFMTMKAEKNGCRNYSKC
jgi:hypothetical protein